jgi:hypothetical protein
MAAVISRFCCGVRPAYHWIVMFGMASSCRGIDDAGIMTGAVPGRQAATQAPGPVKD